MLSLAFLLLFAADPAQVNNLLRGGLLDLQHGQLTQARTQLEQAAKLDPSNPLVWASLVRAYSRLKQPALAQNAAEQAEKTGSGNAIVAHALASYYSQNGNFAHAAELESEYAKSPNADPAAAERAAGLYLNAGQPDKSLPLAREAAANHPSPQAEDLLGRVLVAAGQTSDGAQHLQQAWSTARTDPQIAFDYAQLLLNAQDFTRAAEVIEGAAASDPGNAQIMLALGVARYGQRRFPEAISAFLKTISLDPRIPQPYLFLGRMLDQAGPAMPTVVADYRRWLQLEPKRPEPPLLLAKALAASNGDEGEAETLLRRSIRLSPDNWEAHYQLGLLLSKDRKYKEAASELEAGIKLNPKEPMPHYHLARVYDRLGESDRANAEREEHKRLMAAPTRAAAPPSDR